MAMVHEEKTTTPLVRTTFGGRTRMAAINREALRKAQEVVTVVGAERPDAKALYAEATEQLAGYRKQLHQLRDALGEALVEAYHGPTGKRRKWVEPDWEQHPAKWPPAARAMWLELAVDAIWTRLNILRNFMHPHWCPACNERPSMSHVSWACLEHIDWAPQVQRTAKDLGYMAEDGR